MLGEQSSDPSQNSKLPRSKKLIFAFKRWYTMFSFFCSYTQYILSYTYSIGNLSIFPIYDLIYW